jgi:anti-sigma factor RsiW
MELSLGVLVLGALEPAERPAVESHLAGCARCNAILAELAPLPGLMHRLDPIEHAPTAPVPPSAVPPSSVPESSVPESMPLRPAELRERLVDAAREERTRRRRRRLAGVAAAAVFVGVLLAAAASGGLFSAGQHSGVTVASATDPRTAVSAAVRLMPDDTGSQLALSLTGVAPEEHCKLVAVDARGRQDVAAAWEATYHGTATITGHTSFQPDQITRFLIVTDDGATLVRIPVHS